MKEGVSVDEPLNGRTDPPNFKQLGIEEKIERLRGALFDLGSVVRTLHEDVDALRGQVIDLRRDIRMLKTHRHLPDGQVVTPIDENALSPSSGFNRRSNPMEDALR